MWEEISTFIYCAVSNFRTTGAIAPSSEALTKAITAEIVRKKENISVLEVGAGTGVFTKRLVQILKQGDRLDVCEINPKFLSYLTKMVQTHHDFRNFKGSLQIFPIPVQNIPQNEQYDYIVSGLPLNAFTPELVKEILDVLLRLLKPNGWLSYFEYIGIRKIKAIYARKEEKERLAKVTQVLSQFIAQYEVYHTPIWFNCPPAYVRYCQKKIPSSSLQEKKNLA